MVLLFLQNHILFDMRWLIRFAQALVFAPMGYFATRFLVALGIPLDRWANEAGAAMGAPWLNYEAALWGGSLILTLVMFWAEGRYMLMERFFQAARPLRLSEESSMRYVDRLQVGQALIEEGDAGDINLPDWQRRVVEWNHSVDALVRDTLPAAEWVAYSTINVPPSIGQAELSTRTSISGRYNKLRFITMRRLPEKFGLR